ncbi:iron-containing alcohol dehydrogenase [Ferroglobus placidus]|nr:iron-containing alcohol dehydrogenase [Ferroglobus placidus]
MWNFNSPKISYGRDSLEALENFSGKRALIITDEILSSLGYDELVLKKFERSEEILVKPKEPSKEEAVELSEKIREEEPEVLVALGGGSVIDLVKAARIISEVDIEPEEITPFTNLEELGFKGRNYFVAIPTTSGTGSEVTWAIVLRDEREKRKIIMANEKAIPDLAIVDPIFVEKLPKKLVVSTGFDALSHAIEAFLSTFSNPFSDALSLKAVEIIFKNFERSYEGDLEAREEMHVSATIAGLAFSNSQVGLVHALAHAFGAIFDVPHGEAIAAFLHPVLEFYKKKGVEKINEMSKYVGFDILKEVKRLSVRFGVKKIFELDFEGKINEIVKKTMEDSCIVTAPFVPGEEDLKGLLGEIACMREKS